MKLEERNFIEERVSVPDPNIVINLVNELCPRWNEYRKRLSKMEFLYSKFTRNMCIKTEAEEEEIKLDEYFSQ